jgi:hypothetical protein
MTARMNISLPDELKGRMDALQQPVNWSGVAAKAYQEKLEELDPTPKEISMAEVVERLRASRSEYVTEPAFEIATDRYGEGLVAGMAWAREAAEWPALMQLERLAGSIAPSKWETDEDLVEAAQLAIAPDGHEVFWQARAGEPTPPARYIHGFTDGALTILDEVKKRL